MSQLRSTASLYILLFACIVVRVLLSQQTAMDNDELEQFRQNWRAELQKNPKQKPTTSGSKSGAFDKAHTSSSQSRKTATSPLAPRAPAPAHIRAPSFSSGSTFQETAAGEFLGRKVPKTALEHFERAVEYENEGNQGRSLEHYRKAFRLDERVDLRYREKHFPKAAFPSKDAQKPSVTYSVHNLAKSFAGIAISGAGPKIAGKETTEEQTAETLETSPLAAIPSELLLHIFRHVALADVASFARLSLVCKAFAYIVSTEEPIWKAVCDSDRGFKKIVWKWACDTEGVELQPGSDGFDEDEEPVPNNDEQVLLYGGSYRVMLRDRPRIHYNGVYISTCNYVRQGQASATAVSWNSPVHIVTYYRFLRFYPDGTCISLLSTDEPSMVVPEFRKTPPSHLDWSPKLQRGRWMMTANGSLEVETIPDSPGLEKYTFLLSLIVKTASGSLASSSSAGVGPGGRRNKLLWRGYWSRNKITEDVAEFARKHDKPYVFSRVRWIEREMGF